MLTYNDLIAAMRFDGSADVALGRADSWLLGGHSVVGLAHWFVSRFPASFGIMQSIYLMLFPLARRRIVTPGVTGGWRRSLDLLAASPVADDISLACFYLLPATGPYLADHSLIWPKGSQVYSLQAAAANLMQFRHGYRPSIIGSDYFMAFPCMHLVQPLIMIWFFRANRAVTRLLIAYAIVLAPCILILEEHYLVDILAAFPVAAMALWTVSSQRAPSKTAAGEMSITPIAMQHLGLLSPKHMIANLEMSPRGDSEYGLDALKSHSACVIDGLPGRAY